MKLHLRKSTYPHRRKSVVVLQVTERTFNRNPPPVEGTEAIRVSRDARKEPSAESKGQGWLIGLCTSDWDNRLAAAFLALGVDAAVVVALVHRTRLRAEPASVHCVNKRGDVQRFLPPRRLHALSYTSREYIDLLNTFSGHIAMDEAKREHLYREIRQRIGQRPDRRVRRHWGAILHVARRDERPSG